MIESNLDLVHEITIKEMPKRFILKGRKKPFSPGMNHYIKMHWTLQKQAKDLSKKFLTPHFENIPEMKSIEWVWSWGKSRFDNDNRQFFWQKMGQDLLKGWKVSEDTAKEVNWCGFGTNFGQNDALKIRIYGERK